jgi:hypothetical protein
MAEPLPPGPPHIAFTKGPWPAWLTLLVAFGSVFALTVGAVALVVRVADGPDQNPHEPAPYPSPEVTPAMGEGPIVDPLAHWVIAEDANARPLVVDVNGDGVDDVIAVASSGSNTHVVAIDGANFKNVLWVWGNYDTIESVAVAGRFVAVATEVHTEILDLGTGKAVKSTGVSEHVWHPRRGGDVFVLNVAEKTSLFDPATGQIAPAPATSSCDAQEDACLTRGERERTTLAKILGADKVIKVGNAVASPEPGIEEDTQAWVAGDRFVARAPARKEDHEIAVGGRKSAGTIDWIVDAAGAATPKAESYSRFDVAPRWDVDDDASGTFVVVTPTEEGAWIVERSIATGKIVWEGSARRAGAVTAKRDRIYVNAGDAIDVYDRKNKGALLSTIDDAKPSKH